MSKRGFPSLDVAVPAIAVPLQADGQAQLRALAAAAAGAGADLLEWRIDAMAAQPALSDLPSLLGVLDATGLPVLATFRSRAEGGAGDLDDASYLALLLALIESGAGAVDVELSRPADLAREVSAAAKVRGAVVVGSSHDFTTTPADLPHRFDELAGRGSDVLKVAVTPRVPADVLALLAAAEAARTRLGRPVVPIAMGSLGTMTRVAGGLWRAPFTFAAHGEQSAPGQLTIAQVRAAHGLLTGPEASR